MWIDKLMKKQFVLLMAVFFILSPSAFSANCNITHAEEKSLLSMSYENFDQAENGWRQYAKLKCYHEMGILIDKYLNQNHNKLTDWQIIVVTWHAGQMYAFNHEYEIAKIRFEHSMNVNEIANLPILWNNYVLATIAFLSNDMPKLKLYRDKITNGTIHKSEKQYLDVVDNLIKSFRQPYSEACHPNS